MVSRLLFVLTFVGLSLLGVTPHSSMPCAGSVLAAQSDDNPEGRERSTPPGEWCQRAPTRNPKAHACACHQANCTDGDPAHLPGHTDSHCLNFCTVSQCRCPMHDCP